ncbi:hypothetical protein [Streptomyces sp. NPDC053069]|uniref:DUF7737 domain-containing protein n=1 Tax=Streptomyces sp. NPDC053069 TaxID=3365695 RepID=UPI0037D3C431
MPSAALDRARRLVVRLRDDAARWMDSRGTTGQWQPGELDERLSRILSKAFLLAAGTKITDESVLLQIKRGA